MPLHPTFERILAPYRPSTGGIREIAGRRIRTHYDPPPIPMRNCDWSAVDDSTYDGAPDTKWPANCCGYGYTEAEAIADLLEQLEG